MEMQSPLVIRDLENVILLRNGLKILTQATPYPERRPCQELLDAIDDKIHLEQALNRP